MNQRPETIYGDLTGQACHSIAPEPKKLDLLLNSP